MEFRFEGPIEGREVPKWMSIESFSSIRKTFSQMHRRHPDSFKVIDDGEDPYFNYLASVKLHGTNAFIAVHSDGVVQAGRRSGVLDFPREDNYGFGAFVAKLVNDGVFSWLFDWHTAFDMMKYQSIVFYGEWCGPGVQKGVACSDVKNKFFAVFQMRFIMNDGTFHDRGHGIELFVDDKGESVGVFVIKPKHVINPKTGQPFRVNMIREDEETHEFVSFINDMVNETSEVDPWILEKFGLTGQGEGYVFYPEKSNTVLDGSYFGSYVFKAKNEHHGVVRAPKPVMADVVQIKKLEELVEMICPEPRLRQIFEEKFREPSNAHIGLYIKAVNEDVLKECKNEIIASEIEWKKISPLISTKARQYIVSKM